MIAALFVIKHGPYFGLPNVDPWDEARDARMYQGPHPVVAHPPCQRWGKMWADQPGHIAKTGQRKTKGDDQGCFKSALFDARRFGGVIEHPWGSNAWPMFGITIPNRRGGWAKTDCGGWTCCVEQGAYGHYARKPTLLLAYGCDLPELRWGETEAKYPQWAIDKYGLKRCKRQGEVAFRGGGTNSKFRNATPSAFRNILISMAESASGTAVGFDGRMG